MGISRDSMHKRRATSGKVKPWRKKRKFELGRPPAMTKVGAKRIHVVRGRGGNNKYRALRLDSGNFSWGTEHVTRKTRIIRVVYNSTNNELVRTNTLVKNAIIELDATPFRQWYEQHYGIALGKKKTAPKSKAEKAEKGEKVEKTEKGEKAAEGAATPAEGKAAAATHTPATPAAPADVKRSKHAQRKLNARLKKRTLESSLEDQFAAGRLLACIGSRPGQSGRADGYILEGRELEFYLKRIKKKK